MVTENVLSSQFEQYLLSMNKIDASRLIQNEFSGNNAFQLIREIIMPALRNIELAWKNNTIPMSHQYAANNICEEIVSSILPPESPERKTMPRLAITTLGDEFLLGKQIVVSCMKASGFNIHDYGTMLVEDVVNKVREDGIEVILVSTRMPDFAYKVRNLRDNFDEESITAKIIVGGAPFLLDDELWKKVGADSMAADATEALFKVYDMMVE
ncbi:cobalamin-dependent protein [Methanolobus sp. ZRKC3]|uniref:cobalamin B12-binding domain-containing protein n=1 Tax=Methanolobus sp. ZRKC3 TaxID=3125786 RepID=UPI00324567D4